MGYLILFGPAVVLLVAGWISAWREGTKLPGLFVVAALGTAFWLAWSGLQAFEDGAKSIFGTTPVYDEHDEILWLFPLATAAVALVAGWMRIAKPLAIGLAATAVPFMLAGSTTPRGDNDGLWGLIYLMMPMFGFVLAAVAGAGTTVRTLDERRNRR